MKVIKCPYCGAEFLPSEIYLRDYFLGKANTVIRNDKNNIFKQAMFTEFEK